MTHSAVVKIAIEEDGDQMATVIIDCLECGGSLEFELPSVHLATLANACAAAAQKIGVVSRTETIASFKTDSRSEVSCDAVLHQLRSKAHLN